MTELSIKQQKAFSLLEMLLVIAIMAIIATLGLTMYQKQAGTAKIDLATIEMQGILQAASAFYLTGQTPNTFSNNRWPAYDNATTTMPNYFIPYLPVANNFIGSLKNPWGTPYTIDGTLSYKFKVQTTTPSAEIAKQLASNLPNAGIDPNDNKIVYAYIAVPAQQLSLGIILKDIGIVDKKNNNKEKNEVDVPQDCPANTTPRIITAAHYIRTDLSDISPPGANGPKNRIVASPITLFSAIPNISSDSLKWNVNVSLMKAKNCDNKRDNCEDGSQSGSWNGKDINAEVMYITYCDPLTPS